MRSPTFPRFVLVLEWAAQWLPITFILVAWYAAMVLVRGHFLAHPAIPVFVTVLLMLTLPAASFQIDWSADYMNLSKISSHWSRRAWIVFRLTGLVVPFVALWAVMTNHV